MDTKRFFGFVYIGWVFVRVLEDGDGGWVVDV